MKPEIRKKISDALTGIKRSEEHKRKIGEANRKRAPKSVATRLKLANSLRGKKHPHSEATKKLLSEIGKTKIGILSSNWKGGITPTVKRVRNSDSYKEWRKAVFERDNYTCQKCGVRGVEINADHIEAFSVLMKKHSINSLQVALICQDLWDVANGRTLCVPCHRATPTYGRGVPGLIRKA